MTQGAGPDDPTAEDAGFFFGFSVSRPLLILLLVLAALAVAFTANCLFTGGGQRTSWKLMEPTSGAELPIGVYVGGCDRFKRVSLKETDRVVLVEAYIRKNVSNTCDDILNHEPKTVQIGAPLGYRALHGCNPSNSVYPERGYSDDDCADTAPH